MCDRIIDFIVNDKKRLCMSFILMRTHYIWVRFLFKLIIGYTLKIRKMRE
jgi:hypothetical protein